jgi:hypothetical protein
MNNNNINTRKTIQINPALFKMGGQKTLKHKEKKTLALTPVISPNNIKNKLLQRIKEHKNLQHKPTVNPNITNNAEKYTDEFSGALNYLSELTKKQKQISENERNKNIMQNKTVKHYGNDNLSYPRQSAQLSSNDPYVSLDLPIELQEPNSVVEQEQPFKMSYKTDNEIPYGCLKGGVKPSYRSWIQTRKNIEHPELTNLPHIRPPTPPKKHIDSLHNNNLNDIISREQRLEQIKTKIKKMQSQECATIETSLGTKNYLEELTQISKNNLKSDDLTDFDTTTDIEELLKERKTKIESTIPKTKIKTTTKRTFTLGKSDTLRNVAVLIKNKQTRKNLINTQKELKKTDIADVRKYLRQRGIVNIGSTCPPDILRKMFESSLMAGEITNTNVDINTLINNFVTQDVKVSP